MFFHKFFNIFLELIRNYHIISLNFLQKSSKFQKNWDIRTQGWQPEFFVCDSKPRSFLNRLKLFILRLSKTVKFFLGEISYGAKSSLEVQMHRMYRLSLPWPKRHSNLPEWLFGQIDRPRHPDWLFRRQNELSNCKEDCPGKRQSNMLD